jgi:hypothetical protein
MVRLYPAAWRERYGKEFAKIIADQRLSLGMIIDVLAGAVDAHLHPQVRSKQTESTKGDAMTDAMMKRCEAGGPVLSREEQWIAGIGMLASTLILSTAYIVLKKIYHDTPAVEGLGYTLLPGMLVFYAQMAYLRKRTASTQMLLVGGMMGILYLIMWGACAIAAGIEPASRHLR